MNHLVMFKILLTLLAFLCQTSAFSVRSFSKQRVSSTSLSMTSSKDDPVDDDYDDDEEEGPMMDVGAEVASNVLGTTLECCCSDVGGSGIGTGFYRNGYCSTGEQDLGRHTVCCQVTDEFLAYSASVGNDLSTKMPQYYFPGLKGGDIWCLCAQRWAQAYNDGKAPKIYLQATHEKTLDYVPFEVLREYAIDKDEADRRLETLNEQRDRLNKLL
jgi:uncharacterized protein (DUF2237 family)